MQANHLSYALWTTSILFHKWFNVDNKYVMLCVCSQKKIIWYQSKHFGIRYSKENSIEYIVYLCTHRNVLFVTLQRTITRNRLPKDTQSISPVVPGMYDSKSDPQDLTAGPPIICCARLTVLLCYAPY